MKSGLWVDEFQHSGQHGVSGGSLGGGREARGRGMLPRGPGMRK